MPVSTSPMPPSPWRHFLSDRRRGACGSDCRRQPGRPPACAPFEQHHGAGPLTEPSGCADAILLYLAHGAAQKSRRLTRMRRQHKLATTRRSAQQVAIQADELIQRIGIEHHLAVAIFDEREQAAPTRD